MSLGRLVLTMAIVFFAHIASGAVVSFADLEAISPTHPAAFTYTTGVHNVHLLVSGGEQISAAEVLVILGDGGEVLGGSLTSPPAPVLTDLVLSAPGHIFSRIDPTGPTQFFGPLIAYRVSDVVTGTKPATGILARITIDMSLASPGVYPLTLSVPDDPATKTSLYFADFSDVPTILGAGAIIIVPEPGVAFLFLTAILVLCGFPMRLAKR